MATNHGFNDGNKRTTLILLNLLIGRSGYRFSLGTRQQLNDELEWLVLAAVGHHLTVDEMTTWLHHRIARAL
jgi:prophage maintenance system killer protein